MHRTRIRAAALAAFSALLLAACPSPTSSDDPSSDATLASLSVLNGVGAVSLSPSFSPTVYDYGASLPAGATAVTLTAVAADAGAAVSGAGEVALGEPGTSVDADILVTAEDGTTKTYTIALARAAADAVPSSDATLSSLSLTTPGGAGIALSPGFTVGTLSYEATVPYSVNRVVLGYAPNDAEASASVANGTQIDLDVGMNDLSITVTAEDGETTNTYSVAVTRNAAPSVSISAPAAGSSHSPGEITVTGTYIDPEGDIAAILVQWGTTSSACAFAGGSFSGTVDLSGAPNGTQSITVSALDADGNGLSGASVNVSVSGSSVAAYSVSGTIALSGNLSDPAYLVYYLYPAYDAEENPLGETTFMSEPIDVAGGSFPYAYTIDGVLPGEYFAEAVLLNAEEILDENVYGGGSIGAFTVSADTTGADFTVESLLP